LIDVVLASSSTIPSLTAVDKEAKSMSKQEMADDVPMRDASNLSVEKINETEQELSEVKHDLNKVNSKLDKLDQDLNEVKLKLDKLEGKEEAGTLSDVEQKHLERLRATEAQLRAKEAQLQTEKLFLLEKEKTLRKNEEDLRRALTSSTPYSGVSGKRFSDLLASRSSTNFTPIPEASADIVLPFVNRDLQVAVVAGVFLDSIVRDPQEVNNRRPSVVTAVQTFGSGKTYFGQHFQARLRALLDNVRRSASAFEEKSPQVLPENEAAPLLSTIAKNPNVDLLLNAFYVYIDVRVFVEPRENLSHALNVAIVSSILTRLRVLAARTTDITLQASLIRQADSILQELGPLSPGLPQFSLIPKLRQCLGGCLLLIHFDEIDTLFAARSSSVQQLEQFYELWKHFLYPLLLQGVFLYCSGRAPYLFYVGRSLKLSHLSQGSPGDAFCLILPALAVDHITEISSNLLRIPAPQAADLARVIFDVTSGVPRLVYYALRCLKRNSAFLHGLLADRDLDSASLALCKEVEAQAPISDLLSPSILSDSQQYARYLEFVRISALRIPLELLSTGKVGIISSDHRQTLQTNPGADTHLDLMFYNNLFVGEVKPSSRFGAQVFIEFPRICLLQAARNLSDNRLPFFGYLIQDHLRALTTPKDGKFLETVTESIFKARCKGLAGEIFYTHPNAKLVELMPFLDGTFCRDIVVPTDLKTRKLPKVTSATSRGGSLANRATMHPADVPFFPYEQGCLYTTEPRSASPDLLGTFAHPLPARPGNTFFLAIQAKDGQQQVDDVMIIEEGMKSSSFPGPTVLLILCLGGISSMLRNASSVSERAHFFAPGVEFSGTVSKRWVTWRVPPSLQIVVMTLAAINHFISAPNLVLLRERP